MQKIAINISTSYDGGFMLSDEAIEWLKVNCDMTEVTSNIPSYLNPEDKSEENIYYIIEYYFTSNRSHPLLIELIESLDTEYISRYDTDWAIIVIPDGIDWELIQESNGYEWVQEKTRKWKLGEDDNTFEL